MKKALKWVLISAGILLVIFVVVKRNAGKDGDGIKVTA
jgi:hypothetical protein